MKTPGPQDNAEPKKKETTFINLRSGRVQPPTEEETNYFREKYRPPFVGFVGVGRRVASSLTNIQSIALALAFPTFLGRGVIDREAAAEPDWAKDIRKSSSYDANVERQLQARKSFRRRYSGDSHEPLPRERYFALFADGSTERSYTLLGELNAYALALKSGYCAAVPLAETPCAIGVVFRGLPGEPNPLYQFVNNPDQYGYLFDTVSRDPRNLISSGLIASISRDNEYVVSVTCEDIQFTLDDIFDMRLREARSWVVEFFRNPPPAKTNDDLAHGGWLELMAGQYNFDLSKVHGWRDLVPVLCDPNFGGNGMTDLFGSFLRRLGCRGLIYPSARSDHGVVLDEGRLVDHWGWNLVNYTGASIPTRLSPEEWTPLQRPEGIYHFAEIESGPRAGSFVSLGQSLYTKLVNQTLFDQYIFFHGPEWRSKNARHTLSVRGYCWYRCDYLMEPETNPMVACDKCDSQFPFNQVALLPRCPRCQFGGDLAVFVTAPAFLVPLLMRV
jgi:hypothetical protein